MVVSQVRVKHKLTGNCFYNKEEESEEITIVSLGLDGPIYPQSGVEVKQEILTFVDADAETILELPSSTDETRERIQESDNHLGEFLSRPLKIATFDWNTTVPSFYQNFNPWNLFMTNSRVSNRISNYKLGKMKLHVKFMVNGNSFFYGRLMACYHPFADLDTMTLNAGLVTEHNIQMSQMPRIFIDPTTSQGGEMVLPFFYYQDYLDLTYDSWSTLGTMTLRTLSNLKHVQGSLSEVVTISVFAWATEVDLQAPTHVNVQGITPQSGKDEYEGPTGPISKVASAIASTSAALAVVPALAPYATATSLAAGTISKIASSLGYAAPVMVEEPQFVLPRATTNLAVCNTPDSSAKLTVDVKQEVTIDPRVLGLGTEDELSIQYIASRDSYLTQFDWVKGTAVESLLWNIAIDPCVHATGVPNTQIFMPACCGATLPFKYWTGSLEYRFQIVASAFHRGRLAMVYDADSTPLVREDNMAYTQIIDIATCREFTMKIANHQSTTLLPHINPGTIAQTAFMGPARITPAITNGTLSVWVINELTSSAVDPTINDDIQINVFIKAGEDFETFVPDDRIHRFVIKPQSGSDAVDPLVEENEPYPGTDVTIGTPAPLVSNRNLVYSGEKITSFRQMLKRYYHHSSFTFLTGVSGDRLVYTAKAFPYYRGNVPGAIHATALAPYNFAGTTMMNYITPAFQAMRGSIRWKICPKNNQAGFFPGNGTHYVSRNFDELQGQSQDIIDDSLPSRLSRDALLSADGQKKLMGSTMFNIQVNPVCEFEVPYYSRYRFAPGKVSNWTDVNNPHYDQGFTFWTESEVDGAMYYDCWTSAGEDFTLNFFTGWPPMFYESSPPLSV